MPITEVKQTAAAPAPPSPRLALTPLCTAGVGEGGGVCSVNSNTCGPAVAVGGLRHCHLSLFLLLQTWNDASFCVAEV